MELVRLERIMEMSYHFVIKTYVETLSRVIVHSCIFFSLLQLYFTCDSFLFIQFVWKLIPPLTAFSTWHPSASRNMASPSKYFQAPDLLFGKPRCSCFSWGKAGGKSWLPTNLSIYTTTLLNMLEWQEWLRWQLLILVTLIICFILQTSPHLQNKYELAFQLFLKKQV